jgi:PAS domain-containing protein
VPDLYADQPSVAAAAEALWTRSLSSEAFTIVEEFGDPGHHRPLYELSFRPLHARDGQLVATYQYGIDVADRLRNQRRAAEAEAARREADALYRPYFQNSAENLFVIGVQEDGGFSVEEVNPAHRAALGLDLNPRRGQRLEELVPPDLAKAVAANYRRVLETN